MKIKVLPYNDSQFWDKWKEQLLLDWQHKFQKHEHFCLAKNCNEKSHVKAIAVKGEKGELGIVPLCKFHAASKDLLEIESYADILKPSDLIY